VEGVSIRESRGLVHHRGHKHCSAVELSALRQEELAALVAQLGDLDLSDFKYVSFHAPSALEPAFEGEALRLLEQVALRQWPIIVHPDAMHQRGEWARLGECLCIENMDKRKAIGQTGSDLAEIFEALPGASFCFDIGHARQVDPTMNEASMILQCFRDRIRQIHVSEVKHATQARLLESGIDYRVPESVPPSPRRRTNNPGKQSRGTRNQRRNSERSRRFRPGNPTGGRRRLRVFRNWAALARNAGTGAGIYSTTRISPRRVARLLDRTLCVSLAPLDSQTVNTKQSL
jgi:hypothetical protein